MTVEAIKAIILYELGLHEDDLTPDERVSLVIEITLRLLSIPMIDA
jgi:hypothetical protein